MIIADNTLKLSFFLNDLPSNRLSKHYDHITYNYQIKFHCIQINPTTYVCTYEPKKAGEYIIPILFGGQQIAKSPFVVDVGPAKPTKIRAYGPGLERGVVGFPATFTVETNGETGALG